MTLQDKLYKLRREKGYSQEELAEKLDVSRQAVSKWERGESSPDISNIISLASVYGISVDELAGCIRGDESVKINGGISLKKTACAETAGITADFVSMDIPQKSESPDSPSPSKNINSYISDIPMSQNISPAPSDRSDKNNKTRKKRTSGVDPVRRAKCAAFRKFPFWALSLFMFLFFGGVFNRWEMSWCFFLLIPIYYSAIAAYERKSLNYFCYPVLALMCMFGSLFLLDVLNWWYSWNSDIPAAASVFWLGSIPLYYTAIAAYRRKKSKYFCFPAAVAIIFLILGMGFNDAFEEFLWLFALIPFYYIYSSKIDEAVFGGKK